MIVAGCASEPCASRRRLFASAHVAVDVVEADLCRHPALHTRQSTYEAGQWAEQPGGGDEIAEHAFDSQSMAINRFHRGGMTIPQLKQTPPGRAHLFEGDRMPGAAAELADQSTAARVHVFVQHVCVVVGVGQDARAGGKQIIAQQHLSGHGHLVAVERQRANPRDFAVLADHRVQLEPLGHGAAVVARAGVTITTDGADDQGMTVDAEHVEHRVGGQTLMDQLQQLLEPRTGNTTIELRHRRQRPGPQPSAIEVLPLRRPTHGPVTGDGEEVQFGDQQIAEARPPALRRAVPSELPRCLS